jgi:hypothetical protein
MLLYSACKPVFQADHAKLFVEKDDEKTHLSSSHMDKIKLALLRIHLNQQTFSKNYFPILRSPFVQLHVITYTLFNSEIDLVDPSISQNQEHTMQEQEESSGR